MRFLIFTLLILWGFSSPAFVLAQVDGIADFWSINVVEQTLIIADASELRGVDAEIMGVISDHNGLSVGVDGMLYADGTLVARAAGNVSDFTVADLYFLNDGVAFAKYSLLLVASEPTDPPKEEETDIGKTREKDVAKIVDGVVDNRRIICRPHGGTDIDVSVKGDPPKYVDVGGPAKAEDQPAYKKHLEKLRVLGEGGAVEKTDQGEKKIPKGTIEIYLVEGTPKEVIDAAIAEFGKDHIYIFPDPGKK